MAVVGSLRNTGCHCLKGGDMGVFLYGTGCQSCHCLTGGEWVFRQEVRHARMASTVEAIVAAAVHFKTPNQY